MIKMLLARVREARSAELEEEGGLEGGFTLIELMVVLLIMGILLAIAIPTFLGVSGSARDRAAQSNLTTGLTDAIAYYQNGQTFDATSGNTACSVSNTGCTGNTLTSAAMQAQEPSFNWTGGACTGATSSCISALPVDVASANDGNGIILATYSANNNTCWYVMNLQATPAAAGGEATTGFSGAVSPAGLSESTAGTYYAEQTGETSCTASTAQGFANWGSSYTNAKTS